METGSGYRGSLRNRAVVVNRIRRNNTRKRRFESGHRLSRTLKAMWSSEKTPGIKMRAAVKRTLWPLPECRTESA